MLTLTERLKLKYAPASIRRTDVKPEGAMEFAPVKWGCVVAMMGAVVKKGKTAAFSDETCTCAGGRIGLGFTETYAPGFREFLSRGDENGKCSWHREPEGYKKSPAAVEAWFQGLPTRKIAERYVVFEPLDKVPEGEEPELVVLYVTPDQLSALVVLANYDRPHADGVTIPHGAGCQTLCLFPWDEAEQEHPRAVVGMTDISCRHLIDDNMLSFTMPYAMYRQMEENAEGSFLDRETWKRNVEKRL